MATTPGAELDHSTPLALGPAPPPADGVVNELGSLLRALQEQDSEARPSQPPDVAEIDNQLVQVRLGIASSLFVALQLKHAAIAGHALRVALTTSAWAVKLGLPPQERDAIEIAALLHDVGAIGIPDDVLNKPAPLDSDEVTRMAGARRLGVEILRRSCAAEILTIVEHIAVRFDDRGGETGLRGRNLPLGSRMIAIAEAFDAMITGHVYRPARSLESAMTELFECAGTQFDPALVRQFAEFHLEDHGDLRRHVAGRWLQTLDPRLVNSHWHLNCVPSPGLPSNEALFQAKLTDNMYDAVIFVDAARQVVAWNHGASGSPGSPATASASAAGVPTCWPCTTKKATRSWKPIAPSSARSARAHSRCGG
jgi:hypothetical protein